MTNKKIKISSLRQTERGGCQFCDGVYVNGTFVDAELGNVLQIFDAANIGYEVKGFKRSARDPARFAEHLMTYANLQGWDGL